MKRLLAMIVLTVFLLLPLTGSTESEYGYVWKPKKERTFFRYEGAPVTIFYLTRLEFVGKRTEHFGPPTMETITIIAFTITWVEEKTNKPVRYEVYLQKTDDGEVNLDSLGHELAHVFDHGDNWHPGRGEYKTK